MKKIGMILTCILVLFDNWATELQKGAMVTIDQPVHDDLYIGAGHVIINAPVHGDVIIGGGTVIINDSISNDLLVTGGTITVNGTVRDDIRCLGGTISISKSIGDDVVVVGGEIVLLKNAVVLGSVYAIGGSTIIDGIVQGELRTWAGSLVLNAAIGGDFYCRARHAQINGTVSGVSQIAANAVTIQDKASFQKEVRYWTESGTLKGDEHLDKDKVLYDPSLEMRSKESIPTSYYLLILLLLYITSGLLIIYLLQVLFGKTFQRAAHEALTHSLKSIGAGALLFIALPAAIILSFATLIAFPVGIALLFAMITLTMFSVAITSLIAAHWISNVYYGDLRSTWKIVMTGFAVFMVLSFVSLTPFIGPLIMLLLILLAFGSILLSIRRHGNVIAVG